MHKPEDRKDGWNTDDDQKMLDLRSAGLAWKEVAERMGRTDQGCCARYRKLVPQNERKRYAKGMRWTEEEEATLKQLIGEGRKARQIAHFMGKELQPVYSKIQQMRQPGRQLHIELDPRVYVPEHIKEDRDRRMRAERDITAEFFGDPVPGQSALDKKQGAYA